MSIYDVKVISNYAYIRQGEVIRLPEHWSLCEAKEYMDALIRAWYKKGIGVVDNRKESQHE